MDFSPKVIIQGVDFLNTIRKFSLTQKLLSHNKLIFEYTQDIQFNDFAGEVKKYIGKTLTLFNENEATQNDSCFEFVGIIESVEAVRGLEEAANGQDNIIRITASSTTLLLESGKDTQSYENQNLQSIINAATNEYTTKGNSRNIIIEPNFKESIPYTVQYKETDFEFICRLAKRYGEWLYYDGRDLQFGAKPGKGDQYHKLFLYEGLSRFNFSMKIRTQKHTLVAYDAQDAQANQDSFGNDKDKITDPHLKKAVEASGNILTKNAASPIDVSTEDKETDLKRILELKGKHALNTLFVSGASNEHKITLGSVVEISNKNQQTGNYEPYGSYRITSIIHIFGENGRSEYKNEFEAVPVDIQVPDYFDETAIPLAGDQFAIVRDNNDTKGLGRVRVQFPWQTKNDKTPWIRIATPHAGAGKGFYFIPEKGEEVVVGFEGGNAENPYVIGTRYNGKQKTPVNDPSQKIIQTRSGNKIVLNDADGSVSIYDGASAASKGELDSSFIKMDGAGNIEVQADKQITFSVLGKKAASITINEEGNIILNAENQISLKALATSIYLDGEGKINISGDKVKMIGNITTKIHGTETKITGGKVKIN